MISASRIFLTIALCVLSYIVPKNKKQILLGSDNGSHFFGNPKYFYLFLLRNKNNFDQIFWITSNKEIYTELMTRKLPVLYLFSSKGFIAILRSYYLITSHLTADVSYLAFLPGKFNKIETWHGTPLKNVIDTPDDRKTL